MKKIFTSLLIALSINIIGQTTICYNTPDGIDNTWTGGWSYKEYIVPTGFKIDSIYGDFDRAGYPVSAEDFIFLFCAGTTIYDNNIATSPFNYSTENSSLYDHWIDLTAFNYSATGVVRVYLPINAGAVWNDLCFAISSIQSSNCLIADYNFSGNANDVSGNGLNGIVNGAILDQDRFGNPNSAYHFDGVDDYIEIPHNSIFNNQLYSISYWTKFNTTATPSSGGFDVNPSLISKCAPSATVTYDNWVFYEGDGTPGFVSNNSGGVGTSLLFNDNSWHNIVATINSDSVRFYMDGVQQSSSLKGANIVFNNQPIRIGRSTATYWKAFNGTIDDVKIYNCALTQQEVDSLFNTGSVGVEELQTDKLLIYPNPTSDNLHITNAKGSYFVTDIYGRMITVININTDNYQLNTKSFSSGIYFIISKEDNSSIKFIKR
jgi:hypothetical protein